MLQTKEAHESSVLVCIGCGNVFDAAAFDTMDKSPTPCPEYGCSGTLKEYEPEGAVMANRLDILGYEVTKFHIGRETDKNCYIEIVFKDHYSLPALPKGFNKVEKGAPRFKPDSPIIIGKDYANYIDRAAHAEQLAKDKAALYEWSMKLV